MKKNVFKANDEQLEDLYTALKGGAPLLLALQFAGISRSTYFYWVAVACIVEQAESQEDLESMENKFHSGVSLQQVRDVSESIASQKRTGIGTYIEPTAESVLAYKNDSKFRKFANKCYEVIHECDRIRSKVALQHLIKIKDSTDKSSRINASGSMWFLERTYGDFFAKPSDLKGSEESKEIAIPPIRVEYVDPTSKETEERVKRMEEELEKAINGEGNA